MIWGLWDRQAESIIDAKLGNTDTDTYIFEPTAALLDWRNKTKKDNNDKHYHYQ